LFFLINETQATLSINKMTDLKQQRRPSITEFAGLADVHGNVDQEEQVPPAPAVQQTPQQPSSSIKMPSDSLAEVLAESRSVKSSLLQTNTVAAKPVPQWAGVSASMMDDFTAKASPQPVRAPYPVSAETETQDSQTNEPESIPPSLPKVPVRSSNLQPTQWAGISASLGADWAECEAPACAPVPVERDLSMAMPDEALSQANAQGKDWDVSMVPALPAVRRPSKSLDSTPLPWTGVSSALADEHTMLPSPSPPKRRLPSNRAVSDEPMQVEQRPRRTSDNYVADYAHAKPAANLGFGGQSDSYHDFSPLSSIS